jgi:uncharacterized protein (TIGR01777 family)
MVTSARGGAIKTMLPAFQFGLGGPVGSGEQWISWIDLDDLTDAMAFSIKTPAIRGAVNLVAPEPVQSADLARSLGLVLRRPALTPLPKFVVKASMGEMGRELLLASQRVLPRALLDAGFTFGYPTLDASLEHQLKDTEAT